MPIFLKLNTSKPVRQRLSRWKVCLTTGPSLLCSPSLTGYVVRRQVKPRPVFSLRQPMQAHYYRGKVRSLQMKKPLRLGSSCNGTFPFKGKNQSLRALGCLCRYSDRQIIIQIKILCKCRLRLSGAYVDATLAYADFVGTTCLANNLYIPARRRSGLDM